MTGTMFKKQKKNLCPTATCGNRSPLLTVEGSRPADLSVAPCSRLDQARAAFSQSTFTFSCWVESIDHTADYHTWTTLKTLLQRAERRTDTHLHSPAHRMKCFKDKSATAAFIKTKLEKFCKTNSQKYLFNIFLICPPLTRLFKTKKYCFCFRLRGPQSPEEKPLSPKTSEKTPQNLK